jgi:hypothetical protein
MLVEVCFNVFLNEFTFMSWVFEISQFNYDHTSFYYGRPGDTRQNPETTLYLIAK